MPIELNADDLQQRAWALLSEATRLDADDMHAEAASCRLEAARAFEAATAAALVADIEPE